MTVDGERIGDRISVVPFEEMMEMKKFKLVLDSEEFGQIGDFLLSAEFKEKRLLAGLSVDVTSVLNRNRLMDTKNWALFRKSGIMKNSRKINHKCYQLIN